MSAIVLVENQVTAGGRYDHWQDVTGERYQFPNQYRNKVVPGRQFVYYRGVRRADGRRGAAEYFGYGVIGAVELDPSGEPATAAARRKWICDIDDYVPFPTPVPAKTGDRFIESIPQNFWAVAVRELPDAAYQEIIRLAGLPPTAAVEVRSVLDLPAIELVIPESAKATLLALTQPRLERGPATGRTSLRRSQFSTAIGRRGEEAVIKHLRATLAPKEAKTIRWVSDGGETPGWDIEYKSGSGLVCIEAKATSGPALPTIEMTAGEWVAAEAHRERYLLALVSQVKTQAPQIEYIADPFGLMVSGKLRVVPQVWRISRDGL